MRYHILTADYDGTLATDNHVPAHIVAALTRLRSTGRRLILATGRELEALREVFPEHVMFDRIVAENGAVLYTPATMELRLLAEKPPQELISHLLANQVPFSAGHVIISTWEPHHEQALEAIRSIGVEHQLIFNKGAVMILPPGVNKAYGLLEALRELGLSSHNNVVIGDAENDHAMLTTAELSVAVGNALAHIKSSVDWATVKSYGDGVAELIDLLIKDDLHGVSNRVIRHNVSLGALKNGNNFSVCPNASRMLLAGTSSSGKTTVAAALVEELVRNHYQLCLIDPEGDYRDAEGVVSVGDATQIPLIDEVMQLLRQPTENICVCLLAVPLSDRPSYFKRLLAQIVILRQQTGHPHFLIMDEAHHLIPNDYSKESGHFFDEIDSFLAITTRCELLHQDFLKYVNIAMTMGDLCESEMRSCSKLLGIKLPEFPVVDYGNLLVWRDGDSFLRRVEGARPSRLLKRHQRKYAAGDMGYNSFYFRGFDKKLNLKAQNLFMFMQIGEGVDDDTWLFHLDRHDYSNWFRYSVKNAELAKQCEAIENEKSNANRSKQAIFNLIRRQYTAPA